MSQPSRRARPAAALLVTILTLGLPAVVAAHAELETVTPADGATVTVAPTEIVLTFTGALDPTKSSIVLAEVGGATILSGGVVEPDDATRMTLAIPELSGGSYEVRWTSASAEDPHIERGTTTFTYAPPSPTDDSPIPSTPSPSPSAGPTPSAVPSAAPSPSPSADGTPAASSTDVLLPILAAVAVVVALGAWLLRNRARGTRP